MPKKSFNGLVIQINEEISIHANRTSYMVKHRGDATWFMDSLEDCFNEIFDEEVKFRLVENDKKTGAEIIKTIKECKKELLGVFKGIKPKFK